MPIAKKPTAEEIQAVVFLGLKELMEEKNEG